MQIVIEKNYSDLVKSKLHAALPELAVDIFNGLFHASNLLGGRRTVGSGESNSFELNKEIVRRGIDSKSPLTITCNGEVEIPPPLYGGEVCDGSKDIRVGFRATLEISVHCGDAASDERSDQTAEDGSEDNGQVHKGSPNVEEGDVGVADSTLRGNEAGL